MKKMMCVSLDHETYHKLHVLHSVQKEFFGDTGTTMSSIIDDALKEYFIAHKDDIDKIMERYHEKGGCFTL